MDASQIPNLPGYTVSYPIVPPKRGFGRSQTLRYLNGFAIEESIGEKLDCLSTINSKTSLPCDSKGMVSIDGPSKVPKWVEMDRKVLRFYGYFVEPVFESPYEDHRIRKIVLYYYLVDDTIHIEEPKQDNSGLTQGVFVHRHKLTNEDGSFMKLTSLRIGGDIVIYGRHIQIVDCDNFTRSYLKDKTGYIAPDAIPYPTDPIEIYRASRKKTDSSHPNPRNRDSLTRYLEAKLGKPSHILEKDTLKKYLDNNRRVLRFFCTWDDRSRLYGQRRPYILHYFLEDDTGEILECFETNSGRDPFPVFQKRGPLIKGSSCVTTLGESVKDLPAYEPHDFRIGARLVLNNREFFIYDCDAFTRNWYKETFGMTEDEWTPIDIKEETTELRTPSLPPHNGFGSREDTKQNCVMLIPKPPKKDFLKLMNKDSIVLRFAAKLHPTDRFQLIEEDKDRSFVVTYFMADDTIAIYERFSKNAGLTGGKFLERSKIMKPNSDESYSYHDLYVGAVLDFHRRGFLLLEADEYTHSYMENNKHVFPIADPDFALSELKKQCSNQETAVRERLNTTASNGRISCDQLGTVFEKADLRINQHSAIALGRKLQKEYGSIIETNQLFALLNV